MAKIFVSSVAGDNTDGSTWAHAYTKIESALAASSSGDVIYVDSAHSYTSSGVSVTYSVPASGNSIAIVSVNRNGNTGTSHSGFLAGASEINGLNVSAFAVINQAGDYYMFGISMTGNNGNNGNNKMIVCGLVSALKASAIFDSCTFSTPDTRTNLLSFGSGTNAGMIQHVIKLFNCTIKPFNVSNSGDCIIIGSVDFYISNLTITSNGNLGAALFGFITGGTVPNVLIVNSDLTGYNNASGAYFDTTGHRGQAILKDCKISSSPALTNSGVFANDQGSITLVNVDSGNTFTVFKYLNALGTITASTSVYNNSTNAAKVQSTNISWQIVTTSLCSEFRPFVTPWFEYYWASTSSTTAGIHFVHDSATNMHDRNIWAEFNYIGNASFPLGTRVSTRNASPFDATGSDWSSDSETWTGTGGFTNPNKQKIESTFTPAQNSVIHARVYVAVGSKTLYLDPVPRLA